MKNQKHTIELYLPGLEGSCWENATNKDSLITKYKTITYNKEKLKYLISNGANPNLQLDDGWSILHTVSRHSRKYGNVLIKLLLEHNADPNIKNKDGFTALHMASGYSNTDSTEETVQILLKHKADPNIQEETGWTPLHHASRYSNTDSTEETVKILLEHGADPNIKEEDGWTPLHLASRNSNTDSTERTVRYLLEHNANPYLILNQRATLTHDKNAFDLISNASIRIIVENYYKSLQHERLQVKNESIQKINRIEKMLEFMLNGQPGGKIEKELKEDFGNMSSGHLK